MARFVDNVIAYRILSMLVKNFKDTQAYKLGIIDDKGKILKKASSLKTSKERDAYTYLHRLVFNMKRIINKLPGGESKLKSMVTALFLIKEYYESDSRTTSLMEDRYKSLLEMDISLLEEELLVEKFMKDIDEEAPTNATGVAVSTDRPAIRKKDLKKYQIMNRRNGNN
jgi:hypothetical protein